jgi:hypothetical protein
MQFGRSESGGVPFKARPVPNSKEARESRLLLPHDGQGRLVLISPFRRSTNVDSIDLVAVSLEIVSPLDL